MNKKKNNMTQTTKTYTMINHQEGHTARILSSPGMTEAPVATTSRPAGSSMKALVPYTTYLANRPGFQDDIFLLFAGTSKADLSLLSLTLRLLSSLSLCLSVMKSRELVPLNQEWIPCSCANIFLVNFCQRTFYSVSPFSVNFAMPKFPSKDISETIFVFVVTRHWGKQ